MSRCCIIFGVLFLFIQCVHSTNNKDNKLIDSTQSSDANIAYQNSMKNAREKLLKFIEKESYQLSGFDEYATIPITYPIDICLMEINQTLYACCLNIETHTDRNQTWFKIFKQTSSNDLVLGYQLIYTNETNAAKSMDCKSMGTVGYIAIVNSISSDVYNDITEGSPIFELRDDHVIALQYFTMPQQHKIYLRKVGNDLFLFQTFLNNAMNTRQLCPILKWADSTFNQLDSLPCTNAMRIEPFLMENDIFIAVANNMDEFNNSETYSLLFKYNIHTSKFSLIQKIKTYGAIDIKHFHLRKNNLVEHYLIVANTFDTKMIESQSIVSNSVIYKYNDGQFTPYQIINFDSKVTQFLPVSSANDQFVLLIALENSVTKTFQFNGWNFVPTSVKFTGGSFGKGVSSLRTYKLNGERVIVVANTDMYRDATNLFQPKYLKKVERDIANAIGKFDSWYAVIKRKLLADNLNELFIQIEALRPDIDINVGALRLHNTHINVVETDLISSPIILLDANKLRNSINIANDLLTRSTIDVTSQLNPTHQFDLNLSDSMQLPTINNLMDNQTVLNAKEVTIDEDFSVVHLNGHPITNLLHKDDNLNLNRLEIDNLLIDNAKNVEDILSKSSSKQKRLRRDTTAQSPLIINQLFVAGQVNGYNLTNLIENSLKVTGIEQSLNADIHFDIFRSGAIQVNSNTISFKTIANIIQIKAGESTLIDQDIRFTQPIFVNALNVLDRLNHINILNNRMDALFCRNKGIQVITGNKIFESITLLEPIVLDGKINISSPILDKIKPIVTINEDVQLTGDFLISGNVTIQNLLMAKNIFGRSAQYNAKQLQNDGLQITDQIIDVPLVFIQPIQVIDIGGATNLNDISVSNLIKRNVNVIQTISGRKTFVGDLYVENGICDAFEINGINLQLLNETILKKTAENQIITGAIQFKRIIAENINFNTVKFNERTIDRLLTKNTDQLLTGNITIHGSVFVTNNTGIEINHLSTPNKIFGVNLDALLVDCVQTITTEPIHLITNKSFANIHIGQLIIEGDFWQMESTNDVENRLKAIRKGIIVNGPFIFPSNILINELILNGTINDISSRSFGTEWLLTEGKQTFLAPQILFNLIAEDNVELNSGIINDYRLARLIYETIWKNTLQTVFLKDVTFKNILFERSIELNGKLSGIHIPDDLVLRKTNNLQDITGYVTANAFVQIYGILTILDTINQLNYSRMCDLIIPSEKSVYGLIVNGEATFTMDPIIETLNGWNFNELIETTWYTTDQFVNLTSNMQFENAILYKSTTLTGLINGHELQKLNENYFSLTKPQDIQTLIIFQNIVHFNDIVETATISLKGQLKIHKTNIGYNLTNFYENILKSDAILQSINGEWSVNRVKLLGNLQSTLINKLSLNNDVARYSILNTIRADKTFTSLSIEHLTCKYGCTVNNINVAEWISKAVLLNINYTIQGTTYLQNPIISHISVLGLVNNNTFNSNEILLKSVPQKISKNLIIGKKDNPFVKFTIDNIYVNFINAQNFTEFHNSIIQRHAQNGAIAEEINSNMIFTEPVSFENLQCYGQINGINFSDLSNLNYNRFSKHYRMVLPQLRTMENDFISQTHIQIIDRLIVRQTLALNKILKIYKIRKSDSDKNNFVVLSNETGSNNIHFYEWNEYVNKLIISNDMNLSLPTNANVIDLTVVPIGIIDLIIIQTHDNIQHQFIQAIYRIVDQRNVDRIYEIASMNQSTIIPFTIEKHHCFITHDQYHAINFNIICANNQSDFKLYDVVQTMEIKRIISGGKNLIILLDVTDFITVINYDIPNNQTLTTKIFSKNVVHFSAKIFNGDLYIAIAMKSDLKGNAPNDVIKIYRYSSKKLEPIDNISKLDLVVQCEFSMFPTGEFILLVQTTASLNLYKYEGISGFKLINSMKINQPTRGTPLMKPQFSLIENQKQNLEVIAINTGYEIGFIECTVD